MRNTTESSLPIQANIMPSLGDTSHQTSLVTINSRFGKIEIDTSAKVSFKHGILGIPTAVSFCLTKLPNISSDQFKLFQCLEDEELSFIVVPSQYDNQLIEKQDLDEACKVLEINTNNLILLFIVTIHDNAGKREISVNAKAPVLIDAASKQATQYVLQNPSYSIQHKIS
jgi:flagellar assembly factor FliW